mmetsp:Transcript_26811/g.71857  ORF Transcript_26811/g.71857 Transcript_26811/m.71857 type:complete len:298 (-) Transcript_26811:498-1391(-)
MVESSIQDGWCTTAQTVTPWLATCFKHCMSSCAVFASSPEVGSSRKMMLGSATSSIATLTRFFCPPEMPRRAAPPTIECWISSSPSRPITLAMKSARTRYDVSRGSRWYAENQSCSFTVSCSIKTSFCGTNAWKWRSALGVQAAPPSRWRTTPEVGRSEPASRLRSVVFPQPLGPIRAVTWLCRSSPETSVSSDVPLGNVKPTSENWISPVHCTSCSAANEPWKPSTRRRRPLFFDDALPSARRISASNRRCRRSSRSRSPQTLAASQHAMNQTQIHTLGSIACTSAAELKTVRDSP